MGRSSWIIGFDSDEEKQQILDVCKEHNDIFHFPPEANHEEVGEELLHFTETTFKTVYKATPLKGKTRAILFLNQGGRNQTCRFFVNRGINILNYSTAIGKRLNEQIGFPLYTEIIDTNKNAQDLFWERQLQLLSGPELDPTHPEYLTVYNESDSESEKTIGWHFGDGADGDVGWYFGVGSDGDVGFRNM
jgi:hypothetical protein